MTPMAENWCVVGASVCGPAHARRGAPTQDAFKVASESTQSGRPIAIVCVSDGHGSSTAFRSAFGSRFAVDVATEVVTDELRAIPHFQEQLGEAWINLREDLPKLIVLRWVNTVHTHFLNTTLTETEKPYWNMLRDRHPSETSEAQQLRAYGATLSIVIASHEGVGCLQLGDGDIVVGWEDADRTWTFPVPVDDRLIGNATTSLCLETAVEDFRHSDWLGFDDRNRRPSFVLVATDGFSNSIVSRPKLEEVVATLASDARADGSALVAEWLEPWLDRLATHGAGDDTTAVLLWRSDEFDQLREGNRLTDLGESKAASEAGTETGPGLAHDTPSAVALNTVPEGAPDAPTEGAPGAPTEVAPDVPTEAAPDAPTEVAITESKTEFQMRETAAPHGQPCTGTDPPV